MTPSWHLGPSPHILDEPKTRKPSKPLWQERSDGRRTWVECDLPGGAVHRRYISEAFTTRAFGPSGQLLEMGGTKERLIDDAAEIRSTLLKQTVPRVRLAPEAYRKLRSFKLTHLQESGGGLYFDVDAGGDLVIKDVTLDVFSASKASLLLDGDSMQAHAERHLHTTGYSAAGDWHTHSSYKPVANPSDTDLRSWLSRLDSLAADRYVGVICSPCPRRGWLDPRLMAFTIRRKDDGTPNVQVDEIDVDPSWHLN